MFPCVLQRVLWSLPLFLIGNGVLCGQDLGSNWTPVFEADSLLLIELDSWDSLNCIVVGRQGLGVGSLAWRTSDGGQTWREVHRDPFLSQEEYTSVTCFGHDVAIASMAKGNYGSDSGGFLRKTRDGGQTWETLRVHYQPTFIPFSMYDTLSGCGIAGALTLWATSDGGYTWDSLELARPPGWVGGWVHDVQCLAPGRFLCCWRGPSSFPNTFALSVDTGRTWEYYPLAPDTVNKVVIGSVSFVDTLRGWAVGNRRIWGLRFQAYIFRTTDGGRSWETQFNGIIGDSATVSDVEFADALNGLVVSDAFVLRTTDGGETWKEEGYTPEGFRQVQLARLAVDYTAGHSGLILSAFSPVVLGYLPTSGVRTKEEGERGFTVVPNPARSRLRVVGSSLQIGRGTGVRLFDLLGRDVLGGSVPFDSSGVVEIDVSGLSAGVYQAVIGGESGRPVVTRSVFIVR